MEGSNYPADRDLLTLLEQEKEIQKKTRALQDELSPKIEAEEKHRAAAMKKAAKLRTELEEMKADYAQAGADAEAEERKALEARAMLPQDVEAGKVNMTEFLAKGKMMDQLRIEARAAADAKLAELTMVVRKKAREVLAADVEVLEIEANLVYLYQAPGILLLETHKEFIKRAEGLVAGIQGGGYMNARIRADKLKMQLWRATDGALAEGVMYENLDEQGLRDLKLNPEILDRWLPALDAIIAEVAGTKDRVTIKSSFRRHFDFGLSIISRREPSWEIEP